tara:strand:+ start:184 stop:408 length:225 start_codon:yes stop_codon:yes gene_type:complete
MDLFTNAKQHLSDFSDKYYDKNNKKFNRDLIIFVIISMCIIYFIINLLDGILKIPIIILLGIIIGMYYYKKYRM